MKQRKLSSIALTFLALSITAFVIIVGLGAIIKRLELTIDLLIIPVILSILSDFAAITSLVKEDGKRLHGILVIIFNSLLTVLVLFLVLMLRGLWKFT